jgi:hypothetical protein
MNYWTTDCSVILYLYLELLIGGPNQSHKVSFKELPRFEGKEDHQDIFGNLGQHVFRTFFRNSRLPPFCLLNHLKDHRPEWIIRSRLPSPSAERDDQKNFCSAIRQSVFRRFYVDSQKWLTPLTQHRFQARRGHPACH